MAQRHHIESRLLSPFTIAVQRSETQHIEESAEARFLSLINNIKKTKNGFIWLGNDLQYINPSLFGISWPHKPSVESKIAVELDKKIIEHIGFYPPGDYFISSSATGISIQYQGFWLIKNQQYYIRKI